MSQQQHKQRLYLSMCVDQQQVAHSAPLHPAEDVLTGSRAALPHQEVTAAGEQRFCLRSSQPGSQGSQGSQTLGRVYWVVNQLQRWRLYHLPWNQSSFWIRRWSHDACWPPASGSTEADDTTEGEDFPGRNSCSCTTSSKSAGWRKSHAEKEKM